MTRPEPYFAPAENPEDSLVSSASGSSGDAPGRALGPPLRSPGGEALPTWKDGSVRFVLGLFLALQVFALWQLQGYQLADSVEYMDRAMMAVSGQGLEGTRSVRSFAFSLVFYPIFKLASELGLEDQRPLVFVARGIQMGLTLVLVFVTMRLGARIAGRSAGLVAGVLMALDPILLRFSVSPVAGIGAALCLTLGFEQLLWRTTFRRALVGGLWLGLAFLLSYKSLLPIGALGICIVLRDRRKSFSACAGVGLGVLAALSLQVVLDRVVYGEWGVSIVGWYYGNISTRITQVFWKLKEHSTGRIHDWAHDMSLRFYRPAIEWLGRQLDESKLESRMRQPASWYLRNLPQLIVWPLFAVFVGGLVRVLRRPRWPQGILLFVVMLFAFVASSKGDKSFRLWLPVLPFLSILGGMGWTWLHGGPQAMLVRRGLAWILLVLGLPFCLRAYLAAQPRYHGAFWQAMEFVNQAVTPVVPGARSPRVGSTFPWAVFLRADPSIELVRSSYALETWPRVNADRSDVDAETRRQAIRSYVESLDWLIAHMALVRAQPSLLALLNELYTVEAVFYDDEQHTGLGPVCVLRRTDLPAEVDRGLRFFRVRKRGRARALEDRLRPQRPRTFTRSLEEGGEERLTFLGWEIEPLPGTPGLYWSTYHWTTDTGFEHQYFIVDRTAAPDLRESFQNNHWPTDGAVRMADWEPGAIVSESFLMLARDDAFKPDKEHPPIGGAYRRGDLLPLSLWVAVVEESQGQWVTAMRSEVPVELLLPPRLMEASVALLTRLDFRERLDESLAAVAAEFSLSSVEAGLLWERVVTIRDSWVRAGDLLSKDDLLEIGRCFLPVSKDARLPDDGRLIEAEGGGPPPIWERWLRL